MYCIVRVCTHLYLYLFSRVGEGTVPLAIVVYIDGSFVKHKIPVEPIYVSVRNLNSTVSGILSLAKLVHGGCRASCQV